MSDDAAPQLPQPPLLTRRTLVGLACTGALGMGLGVSACLVAARGQAPAPLCRQLTDAEATLLIALCEQIIPRDDAPGATDAGVIHYIDRQLGGPFQRHLPAYRGGLAAVQATCQRLHGRAFTDLPWERQTAMLKAIEAREVPAELWKDPSPQQFLRLLIDHTRQGFYGSPRHGGNRGYASYRMLGLAAPAIIGQNRYPAAEG